MSDMESVFKIVAEALAIVFIPIAAIAALAAVRVIWKRGSRMGDELTEVTELRARVEQLEQAGQTSGEFLSQERRMAELEERLDFAERLLTSRSDAAQLPLHRTPV